MRDLEKGNFGKCDVEVLVDKMMDDGKFESNLDYPPCLGKDVVDNCSMDNHQKNRLAVEAVMVVG